MKKLIFLLFLRIYLFMLLIILSFYYYMLPVKRYDRRNENRTGREPLPGLRSSDLPRFHFHLTPLNKIWAFLKC